MDSHHQQPPDLEIIERYVLGKLTSAERAEIERLIEGNPQWAEAVDRELRLAAGVRRLGRNQLKARLRSKLEPPQTSQIPWPRVIAVAATVIIVVGIAVVTQWSRLHHAPPSQSDKVHTEIAGELKQGPVSSPQQEGSPEASVQPPANEQVEESPSSQAVQRAEKSLPTASSPAVLSRQDAGVGAASKRSEGGTWTEAHVYRAPSYQEALAQKSHLKAEPRRAQQVLSDEDRATTREKTSEVPGRAPVLLLDQRAFATLSPTLQARFPHEGTAAMPAWVGSSADTLRVIIFPSAPFATEEIQQATLAVPAQDSLLITIARQQIGLRLPSHSLPQHFSDSSRGD